MKAARSEPDRRIRYQRRSRFGDSRRYFSIHKHVAFAHENPETDRVGLIVSRPSFQPPISNCSHIKIGRTKQVSALCFSSPAAANGRHLNDGYCLWLGTIAVINKTISFHRLEDNTYTPLKSLLKQRRRMFPWIWKRSKTTSVYLNKPYSRPPLMSHLPLAGRHMPLLARDPDFMIKDFFSYISSRTSR